VTAEAEDASASTSESGSAPTESAGRPRVALPPAARAFQGRPAGLVTRTVACVIDGVVVVALLVGAYCVVAGARFMVHPHTFTFPEVSAIVGLTSFFIVLVGYLTATWATTGRSYGDHVMGLRVRGPRGRRIGWAWSFVRAVACAFFPIGLFWVLVSRNNRSVQDLVLRTSVVYDWQEGV
jgi:uncharacterized RDD family membrane protein YckC